MTSKHLWAFELYQISYIKNFLSLHYVQVNLPGNFINMLHFNKKFDSR